MAPQQRARRMVVGVDRSDASFAATRWAAQEPLQRDVERRALAYREGRPYSALRSGLYVDRAGSGS
jgi:hypothetical protein